MTPQSVTFPGVICYDTYENFGARYNFALDIVNEGTFTLRTPTNRPCDIPTHTICPPNILSTVTIFYCDTLTL